MKIKIRVDRVRFTILVPLWMGSVAIRCIPERTIGEQQKRAALVVFKSCRRTLKDYKGLKIVDIETANGEIVTITV